MGAVGLSAERRDRNVRKMSASRCSGGLFVRLSGKRSPLKRLLREIRAIEVHGSIALP